MAKICDRCKNQNKPACSEAVFENTWLKNFKPGGQAFFLEADLCIDCLNAFKVQAENWMNGISLERIDAFQSKLTPRCDLQGRPHKWVDSPRPEHCSVCGVTWNTPTH